MKFGRLQTMLYALQFDATNHFDPCTLVHCSHDLLSVYTQPRLQLEFSADRYLYILFIIYYKYLLYMQPRIAATI